MKRAALYLRVSTPSQSEQGTSLDSQLADCRAYAHAQGYRVVGEHTDVYTGASMSRAGLDTVMQEARAGAIDVVVCLAIDRAARDLGGLIMLDEELTRYNVALEFVRDKRDATPQGELFFHIKGAFGQYERELIKARTQRGKLQTIRNGTLIGTARTAYGYTYNRTERTLSINEQEAEVVRRIFDWCALDGYPLTRIARTLNETGVPHKGARFWRASTVRDILRRELYAGKWTWHKFAQRNGRTSRQERPKEEWLTIDVPAIVTEDTYNAAQERLQANKRHARRNAKHTYILSGLLFCGACNRRMVGTTKERSYYYCPRKGEVSNVGIQEAGCTQLMIRREVIEAVVWQEVCYQIGNPELVMQRLRRQAEEQQQQPIEHDTAYLERALHANRQRLERLLDLYLEAGIDKPTYTTRSEALKGEIAHTEALIQQRTQLSPTNRVERARSLLERTHAIRHELPNATPEQRAAFLRDFGITVRPTPDALTVSVYGLPLPADNLPTPKPKRKNASEKRTY